MVEKAAANFLLLFKQANELQLRPLLTCRQVSSVRISALVLKKIKKKGQKVRKNNVDVYLVGPE
jgi:hypothetical protein